jgi:hypothetical protein
MEIAPGMFVSDTSTDAWEFDPEVNGDIHVLVSIEGFDAGCRGSRTPWIP